MEIIAYSKLHSQVCFPQLLFLDYLIFLYEMEVGNENVTEGIQYYSRFLNDHFVIFHI